MDRSRATSEENESLEYEDDSSNQKAVGAKTYAFWILVVLLCLLAWANLILTTIIFSVLRLGQNLECMELMPKEGLVKFFGNTNFGNLQKPDGKLDNFAGLPTELKGVRGPVILEVQDLKGRVRNSLVLEQNGTHFKGINSFKIGEVFNAESPEYKLPLGVRNVQANLARSSRVSSPLNEKLILRSDHLTKLRGSEGTRIEGKEILWTADQEVRLKSVNGSIILSGKGGISLDMKSIPIVTKGGLGGLLIPQYKVCVCMPQGKLFRVPVSIDYNSQVACRNIDISAAHNPCM